VSATFQGVTTRDRLRPSARKCSSVKVAERWSPSPTLTGAGAAAAGAATARAKRIVLRVSVRAMRVI
jgi:hypothetical protein